jgi:hypothetical protein
MAGDGRPGTVWRPSAIICAAGLRQQRKRQDCCGLPRCSGQDRRRAVPRRKGLARPPRFEQPDVTDIIRYPGESHLPLPRPRAITMAVQRQSLPRAFMVSAAFPNVQLLAGECGPCRLGRRIWPGLAWPDAAHGPASQPGPRTADTDPAGRTVATSPGVTGAPSGPPDCPEIAQATNTCKYLVPGGS